MRSPARCSRCSSVSLTRASKTAVVMLPWYEPDLPRGTEFLADWPTKALTIGKSRIYDRSMSDTDFLAAIKQQQAADGLSDAEFARRLGVSHAMWSRVKHGKRGMGREFIRAALRAYPALAAETLRFFSAETSTIGKSSHADTPSEAAS
jgi:hypothetical protein